MEKIDENAVSLENTEQDEGMAYKSSSFKALFYVMEFMEYTSMLAGEETSVEIRKMINALKTASDRQTLNKRLVMLTVESDLWTMVLGPRKIKDSWTLI